METIFIPDGSGPSDPGRRALLDALVGADLSTLSPREVEVFAGASEHGECYWATIDTDAIGVVATSDMGSPDSLVKLTVPSGTSNRRLLAALDAAIQVLVNGDQ